MKKRLFALLMAVVMVFSLAACSNGGDDENETPVSTITATPTPAPDPTTAPAPVVVDKGPASVDFEDGIFDFVNVYLNHATSDESVLSIADFNGSKALKIETTNAAKFPWVAVDVYSLLGENAANVARLEADFGVEGTDGQFYAVEGDIYTWLDGAMTSKLGQWSVFMAKKNPNTAKIDLAEYPITADNGIVLFSTTSEVSKKAEEGGNGEPSILYMDNIRFYDAAGNVIMPATTQVAFAAPAGFANEEADRSNLTTIAGVEFEGFSKSAAGWAQDGLEMPQEIIDALVPGSFIEVDYTSEDGKLWIVMPWATAGWMRVGCGDDFSCPDIYFNDSHTTAQIPYEAIAAICGEDKTTWGAMLQFEGSSAWEVFGVRVGSPKAETKWEATAEFAGFATSAGGWAQNGFEMPQEIIDALVPGSFIKAEYTTASVNKELWAVLPWATAGWMRVGDGEYCGNAHSAAECDGSTCYISYEQIAEICGEDKTTWGAMLQFESSDAWEVFSVEVGTFVEVGEKKFVSDVEFAGFATSAGGWAQNGFEMPQEVIDALVPGSVIKAAYTTASANKELWAVMPWATAGWMRVGDGEYCGNAHSAAECDGSTCYITYEQIAEICGEDKTTWGAMMQFESSDAWEVYSVEIGHYETVSTPKLRNITEFPGFATSAGGWAQNGFEMPAEFVAKLVPGSVLKINYTSENGELWLVLPWATAGWMRVGDGEYCGNAHSAAICDGTTCYVTYEQIAEICGDDASTWGAMLQCEASGAWEVYSLSIGQQ